MSREAIIVFVKFIKALCGFKVKAIGQFLPIVEVKQFGPYCQQNAMLYRKLIP